MSEPRDTNRRGAVLFDPDAAWVPLGKFIGAVVIVSSGAVWAYQVNARLDAIEKSLLGSKWANSVDAHLTSISETLDGFREVQWTEADMRTWAAFLRVQNPTLSVPPPEHIKNGK